ncbi:CIC11C00000001044 [Sungouiella intermedia]|uniref:CIC11C00000001044 n=1 Tax=Sungouiella intermedia TaxID=45354 RepID=A0A1L0BUS0_9ASCO|nr:CIC11C00000001044 [[Candida] intermedia]
MHCLKVLIYTFLVIVCQATTPLTDPVYSTIAPTESVVYTPPPLPTLTTSSYVLQSRPTSEFYPTDFSLLNLFDSRSDVSYDNLVLMFALWTDYTRLAPSFFSRWRTELNLIYLEMGISGDVVSENLAFISRIQHGSTGYVIGTVVRSAPDYICAYPSPTTTEQYTLDQPETSIDTAPKLTNSFGISTVTSDTTTPYVPDGYELFIARSDISSQYSVFYQVPRYTSLRMPWSDYASLYLSFYSRYLSEFNFFELSLGFVSPDVMAEQRSQLSLYAEDYMDGYSSDDYGYIETYITESNDYSIGYSGVSPSPSDAESSGAFASSTSGSNQSGVSSSSSTSSFSSLDSSVDSSLESASSSSLSGISFGPASGSSTGPSPESSSGGGSGALSGSSGMSTAVGVSSGSSASSTTTSSTSSSAIADTAKPYLILGAVIGSLPFLII